MIRLVDVVCRWLGCTRWGLTLVAAGMVLAWVVFMLAAAAAAEVDTGGGGAFLYALVIALLVQVGLTLMLPRRR